MLSARAVTLAVGDFLLTTADLSLSAGDAIWLKGPNGAGKSTLLKCLAGIFRPNAEQLEVADCSLANSPVRYKQQVVYASSRCHGYPDFTVARTLDFCSPLYPRWNHGLAAELPQRLHLPCTRTIDTLSTGMLAKLSFVIAASSGAQVLLVDELLGPVDGESRGTIAGVVRDLLNQGGALVYCSHHDDELTALATRNWYAADGHIAAAQALQEHAA
jgi:ABC-2 type transport system ATP-binding protein